MLSYHYKSDPVQVRSIQNMAATLSPGLALTMHDEFCAEASFAKASNSKV